MIWKWPESLRLSPKTTVLPNWPAIAGRAAIARATARVERSGRSVDMESPGGLGTDGDTQRQHT